MLVESQRGTSQLLTEAEAADYLNTTASHVRRLRVRGDIECVRMGRKVRYHIEELERFINELRS